MEFRKIVEGLGDGEFGKGKGEVPGRLVWTFWFIDSILLESL